MQEVMWSEEDDSAREDESDVAPGTAHGLASSVLASTDWTTETILSQLKRGNIELNPRFQRRDAWKTPERKSRFIESIIIGLPIPQIVLAERLDRRGSYIVIDGKQRLLTLRQFAASGDGEFDPLKLAGLEVRPDLNGMGLEALRANPAHADDLNSFENQTIRTVVVRNWADEEFLYLIFHRLNTGSVPLSPQELRQALHPGPFLDFADDFARQNLPIHRALGADPPDFRMRDVELLVRYFAFERYLDRYGGNLKLFLDVTCQLLNAAWPESENSIRASANACEAAIRATRNIFEKQAFRRWTGDRWERSFNRAVFDAMVFYFRDARLAEQAVEMRQHVKRAFQELSVENREFGEALLTTTKTVAATHTRLFAWGNALGTVMQRQLPVPTLMGNRIVYAD